MTFITVQTSLSEPKTLISDQKQAKKYIQHDIYKLLSSFYSKVKIDSKDQNLHKNFLAKKKCFGGHF